MRNNFLKFIAVCLLSLQLVSHQSVQAAIVDNGSYTTDTVSGLDWLDLTTTETLGKSYFDVELLLAVGKPYNGWRFAELSELDGLILNYTNLQSIQEVNNSTDPNLFNGLITMLGQTNNGEQISKGLLKDILQGSSSHLVKSVVDRADTSRYELNGYQNPNKGVSDIGSFLVRATTFTEVTAVPEPQTYAMFLLGMALLGFATQRRKSN